ncbi:MAG: glutamine synthetase family protein [Pseudomonadota bacterium]
MDRAAASDAFPAVARAYLDAHPETEAVELFFTDLNCVARGKLLPVDALEKIGAGAVRMPVSSLATTLLGNDVSAPGIAIDIGDPDGVFVPEPASLSPLPGAERPTAQVLGSLTDPGGDTLAEIDARACLLRQKEALAARGLTAVAAVELEFYLLDRRRDAAGHPQPPCVPGTGERLSLDQIYDLGILRAFEPVLAEMRAAAQASGAPADTLLAEYSAGQFETNLSHVADPVRAADDAILLKRAVRGIAAKHGLDATFMAKPYGHRAGCGMHIHLSLLDETGENLFASGTPGAPNQALRHVLGGLITTIGEGMLICAPHLNSYRRFMPSSFAPRAAAWGTDNRGSALRCPATSGAAARVENRLPGADANPYLVLALMIGGALKGLDARCDPGEPVAAEARPDDGLPLPLTWEAALSAWERSSFVEQVFGGELKRVYAAAKAQEQAAFLAEVSRAELDAGLRRV